jgi:hypothetical protein
MSTQFHPVAPDLRKGKAVNLSLAEPAAKGSSPPGLSGSFLRQLPFLHSYPLAAAGFAKGY